MASIRDAVEKRYGPADNVGDFVKKAQLAIYENVRAQNEAYGALGWDTHKMTIFWMLNNHWPSFFGHLFDYYMKQGGGYFAAKKALQPLSVVFDGYATGDRSKAKIYLVNQSLHAKDMPGGEIDERISENDCAGRDDVCCLRHVRSCGQGAGSLSPRTKGTACRRHS